MLANWFCNLNHKVVCLAVLECARTHTHTHTFVFPHMFGALCNRNFRLVISLDCTAKQSMLITHLLQVSQRDLNVWCFKFNWCSNYTCLLNAKCCILHKQHVWTFFLLLSNPRLRAMCVYVCVCTQCIVIAADGTKVMNATSSMTCMIWCWYICSSSLHNIHHIVYTACLFLGLQLLLHF